MAKDAAGMQYLSLSKAGRHGEFVPGELFLSPLALITTTTYFLNTPAHNNGLGTSLLGRKSGANQLAV